MCPNILQTLVLPLLIVLHTKNVVLSELEDGKSSLAFVFDTTGSMYNDLKQLREGAEMILKTALEEGSVIGDFVFVPFHDPAVGPATVTQDKSIFKTALENVRVYGGGDCPEKSLGGIQLALEVSAPRSYIYVFTDATAGDHRLGGKVLDHVQRKQSQVVFVLTGHCNDLDKPSFKVYQQIAAASSGQVFYLNKTSVHKVLDFVKSSIKGSMVNLGSSVNPAGSNYTQGIPVDSTLGEVTVSVSGTRPQIKVVDPSGEQLTGPPKLITTLDLSEIMVVKVMQPEPGNWTITVGSEEEYSVKVSGLSNLTFNHGFSVENPTAMSETSYRPLKGTYNHMMIGLTQKEPPVSIEFAEVMSMNGSTLFELPLTEVDTENKVYLAEAFIPPDEEFFYIAINGKDEHNQPLRRIGTTAVQAKVPDAPYLTTSRKITAHAHSRVVLKCKVESLVPVTAMWMKAARALQPQISSLQTTSIEYVLEDIKEESVGNYKCYAKNIAGVSKALTQIRLLVDLPQVSIEPANKTLEIGENLTLTCTVLSEALLLDFQFISNLSEAKNTKIKVDPNIDGKYVFNKTIENASKEDEGSYTCIATNKGGSTNHSTVISVQSKPTAQILGPHTLYKAINSSAQLICQVDNCYTVKWLHSGVVLKNSTVNGSTTDVLEINVAEDGDWRCVAERGAFKASDSIEITVLIKPSVSIKGERNITVLNGTIHELECEVIAKPRPRIIWHRETEEFLNHSISEPKHNTYRSILKLNSSLENIAATYFCYGENAEGITQDHVDVNVRRKITVVNGLKDASEELYKSVRLACLIDAHPPVQIAWHHNGTILNSTDNAQISDDNTTLSIKRVNFDDLGMYICEADNGFERVTLNGTLCVHGLENPVIVKKPAKVIINKGESTLITCRILKGNPTPTVTWQYKSAAAESFSAIPNNGSPELSIEASVQNQGVYRCVAQNVLAQDLYDVEVVVHYPPQLVDVSPNKTNTFEVETGGVATLECGATGVPPPIMLWTKNRLPMKFSKNIHLTEEGLTIDKITDDDSGSYLCNATSSMGSVQKQFTLLVYETPKITSNSVSLNDTPLEVLEGQLVELPCEGKGVPKPVVSWQQNGAQILNDRMFVDDFGIRFVANLTDFGNYTCTAKNQYGNTSITYSVYIWVPPSIKPPFKTSEDVLVGDDVTLQCDVIGFPVPIVQWAFKEELLKENTTDISFNDVGNLYIANASSEREGTYVCLAENLVGMANKFYKVNVNEPPRIIEDSYTGPYLATNLDTALTIACTATGKPKPYVVWSKDNVYLHKDSQYDLGKDGTLTIKSPSEDMSGHFTCTAKNKFGTANKTIAVEVYSLPTREQSEESQSIATVLEHGSAAVECPIRASYADTVKWYKNAELVTTGHLNLTNISRDIQATYACVVTNAVGSAYSTVTVDVQWPPDFVDNTKDNEDNGVNGEKDATKNFNKLGDMNIGKYVEINIDSANYFAKLGDINNSKNDNEVTDPTKNVDKLSDMNDVSTDSTNNVDEIKNNTANANTIKSGKYKVDSMQNVEAGSIDKTTNVVDMEQNIEKKKSGNSKGIKNVIETGNENIDRNKEIIKLVEVVKGEDAYLDCETDAKPIAKIKWFFNAKPIIFEDKSYLKLMSVQQRNAGTYKCVASNAHGTVHRQFRLNVSVPPHISNLDVLDVSLLEGVDATLECNAKGYPEPSIHWTYNNTNWNLQNSTLTATNITAHSQGIFRCDARNKAGATHIVYRVTVVSSAKVDDIVAYSDGEGVTIDKRVDAALGAHIRISCKASGNPAPSIQWLRNGKVLSESSKYIQYADLVLDVKASHAGGYSCVVANEGGSEERTIKLEVLEPPKIFQSIFQNESHVEVLSAQSYYLHCHPLGNPIPEVYWFKDSLPLKLFDNSMELIDNGEVIMVQSAREEQAGNYTCVARNSVGNASVSYLVRVLVPPPQPKESSIPVKVRVGKPLTLACPVRGAPRPNVMWIKHPYTVVGEATPRITLSDDNITLLINHTQVSDSGNYSCVMSNAAGSSEAVYSVSVDKPPSIAGTVAAESHVVALRRSIVLKCEADGHPLPTINWLKDTQKLSDTSSNVHRVLGNSLLAIWSVTSRDAGQYICVVENDAGTAHRRYNLAVQVPGKWSAWSQWSFCNVTCGLGQQQRARSCQYIGEDNNIIDKTSKPDKIVIDESSCKGSSNEKRKCQMPSCEEVGDGVWTPWSRWSACSRSCEARAGAGAGTQARTRKCQGKLCEGDNVQMRKCLNLPKCSSNEEDFENDVYSNEESNINYKPEAVFEKQPEIVNSLYSPEVEDVYGPENAPPSKVVYDVNVTHNIDGSDMGACSPGFRSNADHTCEDIDECEIENNHCHSTQVCANTVGGYRCSCSIGYESLGVGQRCMDINECLRGTSGCEFACVNTAGGHTCACPRRMRLRADRRRCYTPLASYRRSYEDLDTSEYLSASVEYPARYKHIRNV